MTATEAKHGLDEALQTDILAKLAADDRTAVAARAMFRTAQLTGDATPDEQIAERLGGVVDGLRLLGYAVVESAQE